MKINKNELSFLIGFLGVLAVVAVYVWVYLPYQEKTEVLETENAAQTDYVNQLEQWASKVDQLQSDTKQMIVEINETFAHFPVGSKSEDAIMYAVELERQDPDTYISAIGLTDPEMIYEAAPTTVRLKETDEQNEHIYRLFRQQVTYTQEFSYSGMKRYVDAIVKDSDRRSIETLNMAYDSNTGILVGTTVMNLFTLEGTEGEYVKTAIPSMPMGTNNIFATLDRDETPAAGIPEGEITGE